MTDVVEHTSALTDFELGERAPRPGDRPASVAVPSRPEREIRRRRWWVAAMIAATAWAFWAAGLGREPVVNTGGWTVASRFITAMWRPELSREFIEVALRAAVTTIEYALLATAVAMIVGVVGGVLSSELFWQRDGLDARQSDRTHPRPRLGWLTARALNVGPRGIHEAIWALILLLILGADPLAAVLAIAIPFGAITAKVIAEMIDDAPVETYRALRTAGATKLAAMAYGIGPIVLADVVSYGFYRLECSVRSSVVVGMIGAGGIGFQIAVSEDGLNYGELWTLIYLLIAMSAVADAWGASLRKRPSPRRLRMSAAIAAVLTAASAWHLGLQPWALLSSDTRHEVARVAGDAWPPKLPRGGWSELFEGMVATLQLSIIAISIAVVLALPMAFLAARPTGRGWSSIPAGIARFVLLFCRAVPPPLWALLVLFLTYPGPIAGGIALGFYTLGVLGRLQAEVVENADPAPTTALRSAGATSGAAFSYGTLPTVAPRFVALGLYRWEVAIRETVVVGLVGAGGLGRLLQQQRAGFDEARMLTTVLALIALAFAVDLMSSALRRSLR